MNVQVLDDKPRASHRQRDEKEIRAIVATIAQTPGVNHEYDDEPPGDWDILPADLNLWLDGFKAAHEKAVSGHLTKPKPAKPEDCLLEVSHVRDLDALKGGE